MLRIERLAKMVRLKRGRASAGPPKCAFHLVTGHIASKPHCHGTVIDWDHLFSLEDVSHAEIGRVELMGTDDGRISICIQTSSEPVVGSRIRGNELILVFPFGLRATTKHVDFPGPSSLIVIIPPKIPACGYH
jgi:hypothetical protein